MMRRSVLLLLTAALLPALPGCSPHSEGEGGSPEAGPTHDAAEEVEAVQEAWVEAENAGDVEGILDAFTDDAVLLPPGGAPIVRGAAGLREHYDSLFAASELRRGVEPAEVEVSGTLAFSTGRVGGIRVERATADTAATHSRYLAVLRRGGDGRWRIVRLMWDPIDPI